MNNSDIVKMGYLIQEFLVKKNYTDAKPKDMMLILIQKGYFKNDHRKGLPLRKILRELDDRGELYLLPQVRVVRKEKRYWFFNPIKY